MRGGPWRCRAIGADGGRRGADVCKLTQEGEAAAEVRTCQDAIGENGPGRQSQLEARKLTRAPAPAAAPLPLPRRPAEQALGQTFSWAVFLGNGLMAIFAGFAGDYLVEKMGLGRWGLQRMSEQGRAANGGAGTADDGPGSARAGRWCADDGCGVGARPGRAEGRSRPPLAASAACDGIAPPRRPVQTAPRVAPFDAAIVFMVIGGVVIAMTWPENYGDQSSHDLSQQFTKAWEAIMAGEAARGADSSWGARSRSRSRAARARRRASVQLQGYVCLAPPRHPCSAHLCPGITAIDE